MKGVILCCFFTEEKVAAYEKNPREKHPEFKALKDPDIVTLAVGSVYDLASQVYAKDLIAENEYQYIISGGNEAKLYILALLNLIASKIQANPDVLETFITEVLDKIGSPVSDLGDRLCKSFFLLYNSCNYIVFVHVCLQAATYLHVIFRAISNVFKQDVALALMHTRNSHAMHVTLCNSMIVDASQNSCHIVCN